MKMYADRTIGLFFIIFSLVFLGISTSYPKDAALFPQILLCLLLIGGGYIFIMPPEKKGVREMIPRRNAAGMSVIVCSLLYFVCLEIAGFYISTGLYLFALSIIWGYVKIKTLVITITFYMLFIYILFDRVLHILLPKGAIFS